MKNKEEEGGRGGRGGWGTRGGNRKKYLKNVQLFWGGRNYSKKAMLMYACTANLSRRPFVWALGRHFKKTKELLLVCSVCVYSPLKRKHGITQLQKLKITHFKNLSSSKIIRTLHSFQGLAVSAANRLVLIICTALSTAHLLFVVGWQINLSNTVCSPVGAFRSKV